MREFLIKAVGSLFGLTSLSGLRSGTRFNIRPDRPEPAPPVNPKKAARRAKASAARKQNVRRMK